MHLETKDVIWKTRYYFCFFKENQEKLYSKTSATKWNNE